MIDAQVRPDVIEVRVTDDGPGIPADILPRVFEKFVRSHRENANRSDGGEGTGLGLAIAKGVIEAHGGSVTAESPVGASRGTRITLDIPARKAPMSSKIRVLVVDDEAAILRFLKPALEANNYELMSAGTVEEATKRIAADTPDIVVLDLGLPDGDGKDVIRPVRKWSDVPIIVLSARDREAEKIEALDLGADDFVNKPFGVGELLARMRTALRHRIEREARNSGASDGRSRNRQRAPPCHARGIGNQADAKGVRAAVGFLARHAGKVVTHRQILTAVWGPAHADDTQYLRVYIGQLRQRSERDPGDPHIIITEPGIGYRIAEIGDR